MWTVKAPHALQRTAGAQDKWDTGKLMTDNLNNQYCLLSECYPTPHNLPLYLLRVEKIKQAWF